MLTEIREISFGITGAYTRRRQFGVQNDKVQNKSPSIRTSLLASTLCPVVIETSGVWGEQAISMVQEFGRRTAEVNKESRSTLFLRQRLSVAVQRGNAACILGTLRPVVGGSY